MIGIVEHWNDERGASASSSLTTAGLTRSYTYARLRAPELARWALATGSSMRSRSASTLSGQRQPRCAC